MIVVNKEVRIFFKEEELVIYIARNNKSKGKQAAFNNLGDSNINREICSSCKAADRKFRYLFIKYWIKFPHLKSEKFITKEKKKKKIKIFDFENKFSSNKRKRIEETSFNVSASEKNDYLNVNYIFLKELNFIMHYSNINSNDFNILDAIDDQVINLIVTKALEHSLMTADFVNLFTRVVVDSDCSRYSFANCSMFIIYEKIYSRLIKNIERSEVQSQDYYRAPHISFKSENYSPDSEINSEMTSRRAKNNHLLNIRSGASWKWLESGWRTAVN